MFRELIIQMIVLIFSVFFAQFRKNDLLAEELLGKFVLYTNGRQVDF